MCEHHGEGIPKKWAPERLSCGVKNRPAMALRRALLAPSALLSIVSSAPVRIVVNPADTYDTWESFGVSFAWWANVFGGGPTAPMLAELVYSFNNVSWPPTPGLVLPGLALNLARCATGEAGRSMSAIAIPLTRSADTTRGRAQTRRTRASLSRTRQTYRGGRKFRPSGWTGRRTTQRRHRGTGRGTRIRRVTPTTCVGSRRPWTTPRPPSPRRLTCFAWRRSTASTR